MYVETRQGQFKPGMVRFFKGLVGNRFRDQILCLIQRLNWRFSA